MQVIDSPRHAAGTSSSVHNERQIPPQSAPTRSSAQSRRRFVADSEARFSGAARRSLFAHGGMVDLLYLVVHYVFLFEALREPLPRVVFN